MEKPIFEAEVIEGLEDLARLELKKIGARFIENGGKPTSVIRFRFGKSLNRLQKLRVVNSVFALHAFDVPRPKALLGQQHFDRLLSILNGHIAQMGSGKVAAFRIEAAGKDSAVFQRLITQLEQRLKLPNSAEDADLLIRIKPEEAQEGKKKRGWELLIRQSARPLSTRPWRKFNYPGAISGPIAAAMLKIAAPEPNARILNLMCGSGTFLAEASDIEASFMTGCDLNFDALLGAQQNLNGANCEASLQHADAVRLPYADSVFDLLISDLPWGQLVGDSREMSDLYTAVLKDAARVTKVGGQFIVITQLKKHFLNALTQSSWTMIKKIPIQMVRTSPDIYLLKKFS